MRIATLFILVFFSIINTTAQTKINHEKNQIWVGYMTKTEIKGNWSLWNDFHYVPENFLVSRHGLTYDFNNQVAFTTGYAWGLLSTSFSSNLARFEHRPWAQLVLNSGLGNNWLTRHRIRYDYRLREDTKGTEIIDGEFSLTHRLRYQFTLQKKIQGNVLGNPNTFLALNNEVLLNFGEKVYTNNLDQFRAGVFFGYPIKKTIFQLGYMYRYQPLSTAYNYQHYHMLVLWINQNFSFK